MRKDENEKNSKRDEEDQVWAEAEPRLLWFFLSKGLSAPQERLVSLLEGLITPLERMVFHLDGLITPLGGLITPLEGLITPLEGLYLFKG